MNEQHLKDMYNKIIETLNEHNADWKLKLEEEISQSKTRFEDLNDTDIFERLSFAIMSAQAKWNTIGKHEKEIKNILLGFKINQVANLSDDEVNEIYRKLMSLENPKIASRLLKKHLFAIRNNAVKLKNLFPKQGSFKAFIWQFKIDRRGLKHKIVYPNGYKMEGVGEVIFDEFEKYIGIPGIKPDTHVVRLFHRLGLSKSECGIKEIAEEWADALGFELTELDNVLWYFCADKYGEICTKKNPKCDLCRLRGVYCKLNQYGNS